MHARFISLDPMGSSGLMDGVRRAFLRHDKVRAPTDPPTHPPTAAGWLLGWHRPTDPPTDPPIHRGWLASGLAEPTFICACSDPIPPPHTHQNKAHNKGPTGGVVCRVSCPSHRWSVPWVSRAVTVAVRVLCICCAYTVTVTVTVRCLSRWSVPWVSRAVTVVGR